MIFFFLFVVATNRVRLALGPLPSNTTWRFPPWGERLNELGSGVVTLAALGLLLLLGEPEEPVRSIAITQSLLAIAVLFVLYVRYASSRRDAMAKETTTS
jgi:hypothetical protein